MGMTTELQDAGVADGMARALAESAAGFRISQRPELLPLARSAILDAIGCLIAGARESAPLGLAAIAQTAGGACTVVGQGGGRTAPDAALVNATAAHALDFDDACTTALGHTSAVMVPALLAVAEAEDRSGADLVSAFVAGVEVQDRIGRVANPEHYAAGWHSTSTVCALGAAAGCAHLLGLGADGILAAISNCTSMIGGSRKQIGTPMKPIHAGLAARAAVEAALLARAGIAGDAEPLSGTWGMLRQFGANPDQKQVTDAMADLRIGDALAAGVLQLKRFPSCAATHKSLDGVLDLLSRGVDAQSVARLETWVPADLAGNLRFDRPQNVTQAQFSMAYCAARVLDTGELALSDLTAEAVARFATHDSLSRITMHSLPNGANAMGLPVRTRATLHSGEQIEVTVTDTRGSARNPLSAAEIQQKFVACCSFAGCDESEALRRFDLVQTLPEAARMGAFMVNL
ncbi:MmgE/PrpD family protein [Hoeflea ulvae]|uniref:MmgE/PrpD family protein n=1 Tax=Hoeflea ulvae TaxID=2983764 RepID=A0ABT3YCZ4_9HYPH|nr:MmgE/PrpD family protein [Hoeflea ulvae]MCY0093756.1 MmgE/PrpD family protein [Hoeflea ulvae]